MKNRFAVPGAVTIWLLFFTLLLAVPAAAQGQNLLTNPGLEAPFTNVGGDALVQVAQGWSPWFIGGGQSASENVQPEYYPASDVTNGLGVPRIRNGTEAQQYHTFFATHDAGLFQRVTGLAIGVQLRFSAFVYVWSSTFDDPNESEDPGGVVVQVGLDPTGGTNPESASIVWSAPAIQYDSYNEYSVTATSADTAVTVFVRSTVTTPVKNNNIYVDDASLVVVGSVGPTATFTATARPPTATPTATLTQTQVPTATFTLTTAPVVPSATSTATSTMQPAGPSATPTLTSTPSATFTPSATPTASSTPTITPTRPPLSSEFPGQVVHVVRDGDTVGQLATLYGSTVEAIITANGLSSSAFIRVGQALIIPVRLAPPATSTPTATLPPPAATATSSVAIPIPTVPTQTPTTTTYIVQPGDTLLRIALRFNTTIAAISQLNGITNPNVIRYGQRLIIPVGGGVVVPSEPSPPQPPTAAPQQTYVVRPGDTLFRIALRFGVPLNRLIQANGITDPNRVFVGQVLVIP